MNLEIRCGLRGASDSRSEGCVFKSRRGQCDFVIISISVASQNLVAHPRCGSPCLIPDHRVEGSNRGCLDCVGR